ncbi:YbfB/YjiJ family MFS transporter [Aurantimonas sp. A3-2-R12]|uniref:YbfB/YjiJ family MFS transporter n=1 Tax=Aurantimonas sp. A3-2-R12 TaxID=3114362 RepID=UPI002E1779F4|nr:YbfB/YjiJ family MFS transporter [Aurantimonas sp. A3-2-R12]
MHPTNRLLLGGFLTLAIVMGVGRFYYTPLLPLMQRDYGFGVDVAGLIAAANFAGYLAGSILASFVPRGAPRLAAFRIGVIASILTTLAMGLTDQLGVWLALRTISGLASAFAMISAAGMVAESLARVGSEARLGWVFGGVGIGIAASGLLVLFAAPVLDSAGLWIAGGLLAALFAPIVFIEVRDRTLPARTDTPDPRRRVPRPLPFWPLLINYSCEGLGYSVFATFIVAIVKSRPGLEAMGDWVWTIVGLAGLPSCLIWSRIAERIGFSAALAAAYAAQIVGVLLPAISGSGTAALVAAVLFGGTFMAITVLTMPLGRHGLGGRGFAILTAGFGLGQMLGPLAAGFLVAGEADYNTALIGSAAVLALGLSALLVAIRLRPETPAAA